MRGNPSMPDFSPSFFKRVPKSLCIDWATIVCLVIAVIYIREIGTRSFQPLEETRPIIKTNHSSHESSRDGQQPQFNVTILVQGPLHWASLQCLSSYRLLGKVIVVHYDDDPILNSSFGVTEIRIQKPNAKPYWNPQNLHFQAYTTFIGLAQSHTEFTIKTRRDACWNLTEFIKEIFKNPNKFVACNVFFRPRSFIGIGVHPSDHVFGGRTSTLLQTLGYALSYTFNPPPSPIKDKQLRSPELMIGGAFMFANGHPWNLDAKSETYAQYFSVVPVELMEPFVFHANVYKKRIDNSSQFYAETVLQPNVRNTNGI